MPMKKVITFLSGLLFLWTTSQAQTYVYQSFEGVFPPFQWVLVWSANSLAWQKTNLAHFTGQYSAYHQDYPINQQSWIITKRLNLSTSTYPILSYNDLTFDRELVNSQLVMISTNYNGSGNPLLFEWDTLCDQVGKDYWKYAANIPLTDYRAENVYIAWEYIGQNATQWHIDTLIVAEGETPPPNDSCQNAIEVSGPFPRTVSGTTRGATFDCTDNLLFWNGVWYDIQMPYLCNEITITIHANDKPLSDYGSILALDCSCDESSYVYPTDTYYIDDTTVTMSFPYLTGPGSIYFPLNLEPLQDFTFEINLEHCCEAPENLSAYGSTENSATLDWTQDGPASWWDLIYGYQGFDPLTANIVAEVYHPYTLSGLEAATAYEFYVRSVCNPPGYSDWIGPYMFWTSCPEAITQYQYLINFETSTWPPFCWTLESNSDSTWRRGITTSSPYTHVALVGSSSSQLQDERLVSPAFDLTGLASPQVSFNWMASYIEMVYLDNADMEILISTDNGVSWESTPLWSDDNAGTFESWKWYFEQIDLTSYTAFDRVRFALRYTGMDADDFAVDNFMIGPFTDSTTWTGTTNQNWYQLGNWENDVPFLGTSACVPNVGTINHPLPVLDNAAMCNKMNVYQGAFITLPGGTTLNVTMGQSMDKSGGNAGGKVMDNGAERPLKAAFFTKQGETGIMEFGKVDRSLEKRIYNPRRTRDDLKKE